MERVGGVAVCGGTVGEKLANSVSAAEVKTGFKSRVGVGCRAVAILFLEDSMTIPLTMQTTTVPTVRIAAAISNDFRLYEVGLSSGADSRFWRSRSSVLFSGSEAARACPQFGQNCASGGMVEEQDGQIGFREAIWESQSYRLCF